MIAGIGAEGCFLIAFSLSIELVGVKATLLFSPFWRSCSYCVNFLDKGLSTVV
jgi:hypothetical protein